MDNLGQNHSRLFQLGQLLGLAGVLQGLQHLVQVAFHDGQQLVQREVDAVVGQAPLREVVGADAVAAVAAADQALARGGLLGGAFAAFLFLDARLQHLQRLGLVAVLAAAVLAFGHDAGGQVHHAHGRVGLVDVLAAGAAGAEGVDAQVGRVERDGLGSSGSGITATVQALVWMRPWVSVAGTRCTRWPPDSKRSAPYTCSPSMRSTISL